MAGRYVRIHDKPEGFGEPGTLIGFSASATPTKARADAFDTYFEEHDQQTRWFGWHHEDDKELLTGLGGVSFYYLEIQPLLEDSQLSDVGRLCVAHVDTGSNYGYLIDDRRTEPPLQPFDMRGEKIVSW